MSAALLTSVPDSWNLWDKGNRANLKLVLTQEAYVFFQYV